MRLRGRTNLAAPITSWLVRSDASPADWLGPARGPRPDRQSTTKPKKTALELVTMITSGVSKSILQPKDAVVSIWPDAENWKAVDKEWIEQVRAEVERL